MLPALITRLRTTRALVRSRRAERVLLAVAGAVFVVSAILAWRSLPDTGQIRWWLLAATAAAGVPLTVIANALEFGVTASLAGHRVTLLESLRIAVLSSAANLLPVPGAVMVRAQALKQMGSSYGRAVSATAIVGAGWLATTLVLVGGFHLIGNERRPLGAAVAAAGLAGLALMHAAVIRSGAGRELSVHIVLVETLAVVSNSVRLYLVLAALGANPSPAQAVTLALAAVAASAVGIFPGGLGLRELLAALLGPLVGVSAATSLLATALDRVVGLVVLGLGAGVLMAFGVRPRSSQRDAATVSESDG